MPNRSTNLSFSKTTLRELLEANVDKNLDQTATRDLEANDTLKEIKDTLKTIKEQNDEIIGDEF